ncbi:MAG TPA: 1-(5-phosphoribosyl)-5-amino-4-imidazole-carboxylate carboxylase, partial [Polyangia bacterium]|nr:1-(5-phosphoribosyl)-5-amino-4-imidazole-carboxylate carboxylase [Polyangia bacterium]
MSDGSLLAVDPSRLRVLLEEIRDGKTSPEDGLRELRDLPFRSLGFANVDTHRHMRTGFPEVVFGSGKSAAQIATLLGELGRGGVLVMATRVAPEVAAQVATALPAVRYLEV